MPITQPSEYLDEAYRIACEYAQSNPLLKVWRCHMPDKRNPGIKHDSVVVGMLDEGRPDVPSDLIVLRTHLATTRSAHIESEGLIASTPFGGGHDPLKTFTEEARKLAGM